MADARCVLCKLPMDEHHKVTTTRCSVCQSLLHVGQGCTACTGCGWWHFPPKEARNDKGQIYHYETWAWDDEFALSYRFDDHLTVSRMGRLLSFLPTTAVLFHLQRLRNRLQGQ